MKDQIQRITVARARLNAEIAVARAMLPDNVESDLHFNGAYRASQDHPEWADAIKAINGDT